MWGVLEMACVCSHRPHPWHTRDTPHMRFHKPWHVASPLALRTFSLSLHGALLSISRQRTQSASSNVSVQTSCHTSATHRVDSRPVADVAASSLHSTLCVVWPILASQPWPRITARSPDCAFVFAACTHAHTPWPTPIDCTFTPSLHLSHALTSSKSLCGQNQATTERTSARARQRVGLAPPAHLRVCAHSAGPGWSSTAVGDATRPSAGQPLGRWPRRAVSRTTAHLRHLIRPTSSALRAVL